MNDSSEHNELDDLLQGWSLRHQTERDQNKLQQRIIEAWQKEQGAARPAQHLAPSRHSWRHGLIWFAMGVAAAALVALLLYSRQEPQPIVVVQADPPAEAWIAPGQQSDKLELMREMERLFDHRLAWIAETAAGVQLEIRDVTPGEERSLATLAVRVVVARRTAGQSKWTPVWTADLVAREEQTVRFSPRSDRSDDGADFLLWAYRVDEGVIAVDSDLSLERLAHRSTFNGAQISGVPTPLGSFQRNGDEFQVFQTVAILDREA